jgi:mRNA interferase MazF
MKGKIVLVPFPFTDLTAAKLRPALVIYEGEKDAVVAFISSKIPFELSKVDILITRDHPGFRRTGLKANSVIRLDKIATVLKDLKNQQIPAVGYLACRSFLAKACFQCATY